MNPDHNRQGDLLVVFRGVHVEEETVFLPHNFPWVVPGRLLGAGNRRLLCRCFEWSWQEEQETSPAKLTFWVKCALTLQFLYKYEYLEIYN